LRKIERAAPMQQGCPVSMTIARRKTAKVGRDVLVGLFAAQCTRYDAQGQKHQFLIWRLYENE
jgi:hypothetical protein